MKAYPLIAQYRQVRWIVRRQVEQEMMRQAQIVGKVKCVYAFSNCTVSPI